MHDKCKANAKGKCMEANAESKCVTNAKHMPRANA